MDNNNLEQPILETVNENSDTTIQDGSNLGKFKDAKSLLDAYNELQAEFTRKSQKLAEFQKEKTKNAVFENHQTLEEFIKDNQYNEQYKKEITEILANNEQLNNLPNRYQVALTIIQESEKQTQSKLNNQEFLGEYIKNNNDIKNTIISDYLSKLNNVSSTPKIISGNATTIHFSPNTAKPKTLKDAGEIFSKMLK